MCKSFEAYFLEQIFKEMQKSVDALKPEDASNNNKQLVDYFKDMTVSEIAERSVEENNGTGLAQSLYEQMRRNYE